MTNSRLTPYVRMFVSYSHKDNAHKDRLEGAIALLLQGDGVQTWSDQEILAGQNLSSEIHEHMDNANVFVFLLSPDFIASKYCKQEWEYAAKLKAEGKSIFRIPIILRPCAWQDFMGNDNIKALPNDGQPLSSYQNEDLGWQQVYDGIKEVVEHIKQSHIPNRAFLKALNKTDFLSQSHIKLQDIFVFPRLTCQDLRSGELLTSEDIVNTREQLLGNKWALIHGPQNSGKTALMRHLFLSLVNQGEAAIYIDGDNLPNKTCGAIIREAYGEQFGGDFGVWQQQGRKTLVLDNLSAERRCLEFVADVKGTFDRVYVSTSTETHIAFFQDEERLFGFRPMRIETLTLAQQEELIKKRLMLSDSQIPVTDGYVDQIEKEVNSIIISGRIFPRYPFYILSILQSHEAYMPDNLEVTAYGHCYQVLIVANLIRSGLSQANDDVGAAFNFLEHLAYETYKQDERDSGSALDFEAFIWSYRDRFHITQSIVNRLKQTPYGILDDQGRFRANYTYYYFLGRHLAHGTPEARDIIDDMCEYSHREPNHLTLLFVIHHTNDDSIIDDILLRTMCSLDHVEPAKLDRLETRRFASIVSSLPRNILTQEGVGRARRRERDLQQELAQGDDGTTEGFGSDATREETAGDAAESPVNSVYRILKNHRILSQVLRNKHGRLERAKVEEIVSTISDSGLRLINLILEDEERIAKLATLLHEQNKKWSFNRIQRALQALSFIWAISNIEDIVSAVNVRAITGSVRAVVERGDTPAYDLIGYFSQLDAATGLTADVQSRLAELIEKHDDVFFTRLLSIRTQHYMNTHRVPVRTAQSVCALLGIRYVHRMLDSPE